MRKAAPLVTVITPTYNHTAFIGQCVESALAQTHGNWEMLILDDGSTDDTESVVGAYRDDRIEYIRLPHRGVTGLGETYNTALSRAKGSLIAILEGDDFWPKQKLELQCADFEDPDVVLSSGVFESTDARGNPVAKLPVDLPAPRALLNDPIGSAGVAMLEPLYRTFTFPVATVIRKAALDRIGGFIQPDYLPLVDYPTILNLSLVGGWRFHLKTLGYWRRHDRSVSDNRFLTILDGVHRYASEFYAGHKAELPATPADLHRINNEWHLMQMDRMFLTAMALLERGSFAEARGYLDRIGTFPFTKNWKRIARIMSACSRANLRPEIFQRMIESRLPCKLPRNEQLSSYISIDLPAESFVPYEFK